MMIWLVLAANLPCSISAFLPWRAGFSDRMRRKLGLSSKERRKASCPGHLIIVRHGQSEWNYENRFTGWANVALSADGEGEALDAAEMLLAEDGLQVDVCFTSVLERSIQTAEIILSRWEECGRLRPPSRPRWRLNERHYGALTGLNKRDALQDYDATQLREWRSSFDGRPPAMEPSHRHYSRTEDRYDRLLSGQAEVDETLLLCDVPLAESLSDTVARVRPLWEQELQPLLLSGQNVLLVPALERVEPSARPALCLIALCLIRPPLLTSAPLDQWLAGWPRELPACAHLMRTAGP